jgi:toxin YoeB
VKIIFAPAAWEDYQHWLAVDSAVAKKINALLKDASRTPFSGIGKPEPLRHALSGYWSRRITGEHRMVYKMEDSNLLIAQLRLHY